MASASTPTHYRDTPANFHAEHSFSTWSSGRSSFVAVDGVAGKPRNARIALVDFTFGLAGKFPYGMVRGLSECGRQRGLPIKYHITTVPFPVTRATGTRFIWPHGHCCLPNNNLTLIIYV